MVTLPERAPKRVVFRLQTSAVKAVSKTRPEVFGELAVQADVHIAHVPFQAVKLEREKIDVGSEPPMGPDCDGAKGTDGRNQRINDLSLDLLRRRGLDSAFKTRE